jgi:hypothetical protein
LRQGNQNPEVGIYRYVVEGSFDAYSFQDTRGDAFQMVIGDRRVTGCR